MRKFLITLIVFYNSMYSMSHWPGGCDRNGQDSRALLQILAEQAWQKQRDYDDLLSLVQSRIENKQSLDEPIAENFFYITPLHKAAIDDSYLPITQLLLEHGVDPNKTDLEGETPLCVAARNISLENIKALIAKKANPNPLVSWNRVPLFLIYRFENETQDSKKANDRIKALTALLSAGANPNMQSYNGSYLHELVGYPFRNIASIAAYNTEEERLFFLTNRKALIKHIIDHGGDLSISDQDGKTPIELAYRNNYHPENKKNCIELARYAIAYLNESRKNLVTRVLLQPLGNAKFSPFMKLPKELVKMIVFMVYPSHKKREQTK